MIKNQLLYAALVGGLLFTSCKKDETGGDSNPDTNKKSGYLVSTVSYNTNNSSYFAGYYEDAPSGNIDITQETAFNYFYPITSYGNASFSQSLDGTNGLDRVVVNAEGEITTEGTIITPSFLCGVEIISDEIGVYSERSSPGKLFTFNPTTMEKTGEINMTGATVISENDQNVYYIFAYREQDNTLFAALYTNSTGTTQFYDATSIYVEVIDMNTKTRVSTAQIDGFMDPYSRGNLDAMVDEQGNVYFMAQGSYGLDGALGGLGFPVPQVSRPALLKIPAGSTQFDESYSFNPIEALDPSYSEMLVQVAVGITYGANGIGYACVSGKNYDNPRIYELIQKYAAQTITQAEIAELYDLIIYAEGQKWVKIDLNARSVTEISGIPFSAGFSYPNAYEYDGKFYFQVLNETEGVNGFYEYDPATEMATPAFNITAGGVATNYIKIGG